MTIPAGAADVFARTGVCRRQDSGQQERPHLIDPLLKIDPSIEHVRDHLHTGERRDHEPGQFRRIDRAGQITLGDGGLGELPARLDPVPVGTGRIRRSLLRC